MEKDFGFMLLVFVTEVWGIRLSFLEVKFLDLRKTKYCESIFAKNIFIYQERKLYDDQIPS